MRDKAILIPANPKKIDIYGNILAHAMHLARYGGVFWGMGKRGEKEPEEFHHKEIEKGYFYNAVAGKVDHAIDIVFVRAMAEMDDLEIFDLFIPHWRKEDFYERYEAYIVLIDGIVPLKKQYDLEDFIKFEDNTPVLPPLKNYSIIFDPKYERLKYEI